MLKRDDASAAPRGTGPARRVPRGGAPRSWMKKVVLGAVGVTGAMLGVRALGVREVLRRVSKVFDHCASLGHCSCDDAVSGCEGEHEAQEIQGGIGSDVDR